jgi:hypothetical protein
MEINSRPIQEQLVSGVNLKTVNSENLLNQGNLNLNSAIAQQKLTHINVSGGSPVSGLTNTIAYSALIPANTFASEGFLDLVCRFNKVGTTSTWTTRIYRNSSNSLTGASLLTTISNSLAATNIYIEAIRSFRLIGGTIRSMSSNQSGYTDSLTNGIFETSATFNLALDNYIIIAIQLFNTSSDVASTTFVKILGYE